MKKILLLAAYCVISNITHAQSWSLTGNAGTDPSINFLGTTDNQALTFRTKGDEQMRILSNGKIGIGVLNPIHRLHIHGNINLDRHFGLYVESHRVLFVDSNKSVVFLGNGTGVSNKQGYYNTAVGYYALNLNTYAGNNTAVGSYALRSNTIGNSNTAFGVHALSSNINADDNTAVGVFTLESNTEGSANVALGSYALHFNISGSSNIAIGYSALYNNSTGNYNVANGSGALAYNSTGSFNAASGSGALAFNESGSSNAADGYKAGCNNKTGSHNVFVGQYAGINNTIGSQNTFIGDSTNVKGNNLTNATAIGSRAYVSSSNALVLGSIAGQNGATNSVKVGIGLSFPSHQLHLSTDDAAKPGTAMWTISSDERLKKNISSFKDGLNILNKIDPVWFEYNGKAKLPSDKKFVGVTAQEIEKIAPYMISESDYEDADGRISRYLNYNPNALLYILVNSVKELSAANNLKDERIDVLQREVDDLKAMITAFISQDKTSVKSEFRNSNSYASLEQNIPNPFNKTTVINYTLPQQYNSAKIIIVDKSGKALKELTLSGKGKDNVRINTSTLTSGVYSYSLYVDGKLITTKQMILTR